MSRQPRRSSPRQEANVSPEESVRWKPSKPSSDLLSSKIPTQKCDVVRLLLPCPFSLVRASFLEVHQRRRTPTERTGSNLCYPGRLPGAVSVAPRPEICLDFEPPAFVAPRPGSAWFSFPPHHAHRGQERGYIRQQWCSIWDGQRV